MVDLLQLKIKAGDGGDGLVSMRHEKYKPKAGPDGGSGGAGGSVYLVADPSLSDLSHLSHVSRFVAESGGRGGKSNCTGRGGQDLVIKVPVGTVVGNLGDLTEPGQRLLVAQGGLGGRGNTTFKSATNQCPRESTPGSPGEEKELTLELKVLADVGLIGLPSAGKSTLLNALTSSKAAIGVYPFTTLAPNLGVLSFRPRSRNLETTTIGFSGSPVEAPGMTGGRGREIVLADLPGLIKGAAQGRGLGDKFLRHTERCQVLVHVISAENGSASSVKEAYQTVRSELAAWSAQGQMDLLKKPEIVVLSKIDLGVPPGRVLKGKVLKVSAHTGEGLPELVAEIVQVLKKAATTATTTKPADPANNKPSKVFTIENLPNKSIVFRKRGLPR